MAELICPKCGMLSPYHIVIEKNNNHAAYCDVCGIFIKFVPYSIKKYQFWFGRYKGVDLSEITDYQYLEFALEIPQVDGKLREAVAKRLSELFEEKKVTNG